MTEKIQLNGKDFWISIEPHLEYGSADDAREYFTASYYATEPAESAGIIFIDDHQAPVIFSSPVEALEYASERLSGSTIKK